MLGLSPPAAHDHPSSHPATSALLMTFYAFSPTPPSAGLLAPGSHRRAPTAGLPPPGSPPPGSPPPGSHCPGRRCLCRPGSRHGSRHRRGRVPPAPSKPLMCPSIIRSQTYLSIFLSLPLSFFLSFFLSLFTYTHTHT